MLITLKPKLRDVILRFKAHKMANIGLYILLIQLLCVAFLPGIMGLDPYTSNPVSFGAKPSVEHILGTDDIGRDLFSRFIFGGRVSLFVGMFSSFISMLIGVPMGIIAGYYKGAVEAVIMRLADIFMTIPAMILVLVLVSFVGPSIGTVTFVIGILGWPPFARLIYANVLSVSQKDYIESARAIGTRDPIILTRYILPNTVAPILIAFTFRTAQAIILESSLSFLGMGVQPPQASWGNILYDAQSITVLSSRPWLWLPPGICLILTIASINYLGDGLRDALDSKIVAK